MAEMRVGCETTGASVIDGGVTDPGPAAGHLAQVVGTEAVIPTDDGGIVAAVVAVVAAVEVTAAQVVAAAALMVSVIMTPWVLRGRTKRTTT